MQLCLGLAHVPACMHANISDKFYYHFFQKTAVALMKQLASSTSRHAKHLQSAVRFNIGRAYFQGYGVKPQSDSEAEKYVGKK